MGFLELVQLKSVCKTKISYLTPLQHAQGYCKIFCQIQISLLVLHWSWHLTQTSMSIIYQNHLVIYFSRLLGFRHASATFCSGNFIGINMHDFFCLRKQHKIFFSLLDNYYVLCYNDQLHILVLTYIHIIPLESDLMADLRQKINRVTTFLVEHFWKFYL